MTGAGRSNRKRLAFAPSHGALIVAAALCFNALGAEEAHAGTLDATVAADTAVRPRFHRVFAGETLSEIAERHGLDWRDLARLNRLANADQLPIGRVLVLGRPALSRPQTYTVQSGETLSQIARTFGQNWRDLARLNGLANADHLSVGQVLRLTPVDDDGLSRTRTAEARARFARKYGVDLAETSPAAPSAAAGGDIPAPEARGSGILPPVTSAQMARAAFAARYDVEPPVAAPAAIGLADLRPLPVRDQDGEIRTAEARARFARKYGVDLAETSPAAPSAAAGGDIPAPEARGSGVLPPVTSAQMARAAFAARYDVEPPVAAPAATGLADLRPLPVPEQDGEISDAPQTEAAGEALATFAGKYGVDGIQAPETIATAAVRPTAGRTIAIEDDFSAIAASLRAAPGSSARSAGAAPQPRLESISTFSRGPNAISHPATLVDGAPLRADPPPSPAMTDTSGADTARSLPAASTSSSAGGPAAAASSAAGRIVTPPGRSLAAEQLRARLPLVVSGRPMPTVAATISLTEVISISPVELAASLEPLINEATFNSLKALGSEQIPIDQIRALGLNVTLDAGTIGLALDLSPSLRRKTVLGGPQTASASDAPLVAPERFAMGATGALLLSSSDASLDDAAGQFVIAGFINVGGLRGVNVDYSGTYQFSQDSREFSRGPVVAFVDRPEKALRFSVGDLVPQSSSQATSVPILGFSMERNYQSLQPSREIRPMGSRSFFLDRPSTIEVISNGTVVKRFQAEAGPVDLRNLPLAGTSNDVTIFVEDALGRRQLDSFTLASDISLLDGGLDEFNLSVGVLRDATGGQFKYSSDPVMMGFYTRGVTNQLTVSGSFGIADAVKGVSATAAFPVLGGVARIETDYSLSSSLGSGWAAGLAFRSDKILGGAINDNLVVRANISSEDFATLYDPSSSDAIKMDAAFDYQIALSRATSVNVGAAFLSRYGAGGDDRFLTAGVTHGFGDLQVSLRGRFGENSKGEQESSAFITLSRSFGTRNRASVSYDTSAERARVEFARSRRVDVPDIAFRVAAEDSPQGRTVTGSAGYYGSRFEADAGVERNVGAGSGSTDQRFTARLQSGVAFADGVLAFGGDPSRGFYLVRTHPSLRKALVEIEEGRAGGPIVARGRGWWPAVGRVGTPYIQTDLSVAIRDAPVGYDVGDTRFAVMPGARSGFVLPVGTDNFRTRTATLMFDGQPVSLAFGHLVNVETGEQKTFFTNRAGRASFSGLAQGTYRVTVNGIDATYEFSLAKDSVVLEDFGTIALERK